MAIESELVKEDPWATDSDDEPLTVANELSGEALSALLEFQQTGGFEDMPPSIIDKNAVCATFTPGDSKMIAATYRRLQGKDDEAAKKHTEALLHRTVLDLQVTHARDSVDVMMREGVVRLDNVLSPELCDACLEGINRDFLMADTERISDGTNQPCDGFGNVFSRTNRYDMYLKNQGVYQDALHQMLESTSSLGALYAALVGPDHPGIFHECSSLISDPGSASQPIHPDSTYFAVAPMWTCFVALQGVTASMGPTIMLPQTHSFSSHEDLKDPERRNHLLAQCEYRRSVLNKGDCAVMDSRCFHFGDANTSSTRRVLFYFTIRNPAHQGDYPLCGSLYPDMSELTIGNFS